MRRVVFFCLAALTSATAAPAAEWKLETLTAPARVMAVETVDGKVRINAGGLWYEFVPDAGKPWLRFIDKPEQPKLPEGALPGSRVAVGTHDIARAWLAQPTERYDHGILGDRIEAGSLIIETRDGQRHEVKLDDDAVFEDLEPRIADIDGDNHDDVVLVKSYLRRGSALAVIAERRGRYQIVAETPPLGAPHRWLDPVGIADFTGDGRNDVAFVRQPHAVGMLELWTWSNGALHKAAEIPDAANHIAGTRAIDMSAVGHFDGDATADIAIPSLDRSRLRLISFEPNPREITSIALPAKAVTDFGLDRSGKNNAIVFGLANGALAVVTPVKDPVAQ